MNIIWHGQACFTLQSQEQKVVIDPFDKSIGLKVPNLEASLVLVTHPHKDHNFVSSVLGDPFIIDGPGEYEHQGIRVFGIDSYHDNKEGSERGMNTIYSIEFENLKIVHLGDLGQAQLTESQVTQLANVDVLMVPVGGVYTIDGKDAVSIVNQIQPRMVIPMHYKLPSLKIDLQDASSFLEGMGAKDVSAQDKLSVKKKALSEEEARTEVVLLKA